MHKLYVFETITANGTRIVGTAGLPYSDMLTLQAFYNHLVTRIVPADASASRLKIKTPIRSK